MHKHIFTLLLFGLTFWQCRPIETPPAAVIKIAGGVADGTTDKLTIRTIYGSETVDIVDGQFSTEIPGDGPMLATVYYDRKSFQVFGIPGDSIHVTFNAGQIPGSLIFSASHAAGNQFLVDFYQATQKNYREMYSLPEEKFMISADSIRKSLKKRIEELRAENKEMSTTMIEWLNHYADYNYANDLSRFERYYIHFSQDTTYEQSAALKAAVAPFDKEEPSLLGLPAYTEFLENKMSEGMMELMEADTTIKDLDNPYFIAQMRALDERFGNEQIINYLTFAVLRDEYTYSGVEGTTKYYNDLLASNAKQVYKDKLQSLYGNWEHLVSGKEAPGFNYPDIDSNLVSLESLKGKLVYIDVWATWCGPCRAEEPYLEELQHAFKDNDQIAFTSISIDEDRNAWRKWIREKKPMGYQLIAEAGGQSKINQDYNIKGIPRFILIDQNGMIVNATANRPSSGKMKDKFEELLARVEVKN